ncbi:Aste57867_17001 [Aphanomyces stellatus]|uniref:Aste57867_17001 protein n=1 Tax=Aphanomyces stellatus TaxID=120398 RepID=A0A485L7X5_9STRA|nr:hypothetical protein As57867_016943 [Aphanomyces stellatus]VFT93762.1 Aste57867_17001 [Aphanomyces stellatus]
MHGSGYDRLRSVKSSMQIKQQDSSAPGVLLANSWMSLAAAAARGELCTTAAVATLAFHRGWCGDDGNARTDSSSKSRRSRAVRGDVKAARCNGQPKFAGASFVVSNATISTLNTYEMEALGLVRSFRVVRATENVYHTFQVVADEKGDQLANFSDAPAVTCSKRADSSRWLFYAGLDYPIVEQDLAPKFALVGYTRPWLLGSFLVWTALDKAIPNDWVLRVRSLKVVAVAEASNGGEPIAGLNCARHYDQKFIATLGHVKPVLSVWENKVMETFLVITLPRGHELIAFKEYNIQGAYSVYHTETNQTGLTGTRITASSRDRLQ